MAISAAGAAVLASWFSICWDSSLPLQFAGTAKRMFWHFWIAIPERIVIGRCNKCSFYSVSSSFANIHCWIHDDYTAGYRMSFHTFDQLG